MKNNQSISTSNRVTKAKKNTFSMSVFWVAMGIISTLGFTAYQFGQNTQWIKKEYSSKDINKKISLGELKREQLSTEDLSLGADLGDLELILKEIEQNNNLPSATNINNSSVDNSAILTDTQGSLNQFQPSSKYRSKSSFSNQKSSTKHFSNNQVPENSGQKVIKSSSSKVYPALFPSQSPNTGNLQVTPQTNQNTVTHLNSINNSLITAPSILRSSQTTINEVRRSPVVFPSASGDKQRSLSDHQATPLNSPINPNPSTSQLNNFNSYQIPLLNYNPLVPTNYQSPTRTINPYNFNNPSLQPSGVVQTGILDQADF
jgi:hypothetical protein